MPVPIVDSMEPFGRLGLGRDEIARLVARGRMPYHRDGWFIFAYRPRSRNEQVTLHHGLAGWRRPRRMVRIDDGLLAVAVHGQGVRRMEYEYEVRSGRERELILDPENPLAADGPFGGRSVALAPRYAVPLEVAPPAPQAVGRMDELDLPVWRDEHGQVDSGPALLWHPPGVAPEDELPLLVFLDGPEYVRFAGVRPILENLIHARRIRPCRAVFLPPTRRDRQYSADPGLVTSLDEDLPLALHTHINAPAEGWIGVGASLGALAMLHAHVSHPGRFGGLLLQSGSYFQASTDSMETGFEYFARIAAFVGEILDGRSDLTPIPLYLTCGLGGENLTNNKKMVEALERCGCRVRFTEVPDAHNWTAWRDCLGPGLLELLT